MPVNAKYPLSQILEMRKSNVRQLEQQLANDRRAVDPLVERIALQAKRVATIESMLIAAQQKQSARMANASVLVHEVTQSAAHHAATRGELKRVQETLTTARAELDTLRGRVRNTERSLELARQKLEAVERHKIRHALRLTRRQENRAEEDATDAWHGLHPGGKQRGES